MADVRVVFRYFRCAAGGEIRGRYGGKLVLAEKIELSTSPLPRVGHRFNPCRAHHGFDMKLS